MTSAELDRLLADTARDYDETDLWLVMAVSLLATAFLYRPLPHFVVVYSLVVAHPLASVEPAATVIASLVSLVVTGDVPAELDAELLQVMGGQ